MEKRKYFCTVKHRADILKPLLSAIIALTIGCQIQAKATGDGNRSDSVEVSLLTCSPHTEVYSLYGHTAIRYRNAATGEDWAFNYGVFNFRKPFFALRFAFGLTDYELGVIPYEYFEEEYRKTGRQVTEQVLNMTSDEKQRLYDALRINYLPENRVYRYNYFEKCERAMVTSTHDSVKFRVCELHIPKLQRRRKNAPCRLEADEVISYCDC